MRVFCFILGMFIMLEGIWASGSDSSFEMPYGRESPDTPADRIGITSGASFQPGGIRAAGQSNNIFSLTTNATTVTVKATFYRDGVELVHDILDRPMGKVSLEAILGRTWGEFKSEVVLSRIQSLDADFSELTAEHLTFIDVGTGKVIDDADVVHTNRATPPEIVVHVSVD